MPTLADIYNSIKAVPGRVSNFAQNPVTGLKEMGIDAVNRAVAAKDQLYDATESEGIGYGPKTKALAQKMAEAYNPIGMTVWHGSPYKFSSFDASKIGKGEGAQSYGHGLYVAENPAVAKGYAQNVKDIDSIQSHNQRLKQLSKLMDEDSIYPGAYRKFKSEKGAKAAEEYDHVMQMRNQKSTDPGNLYKVDLPDKHIEKMLDWDSPLHQQPANVQKALGKLGFVADKTKINEFDDALLSALQGGSTELPKQPMMFTGESIYKKLGNPQEASEKLQALGIPGIKYYDQGSRDLAEGTRNFVVFPGNENLLKIQDINGNLIK